MNRFERAIVIFLTIGVLLLASIAVWAHEPYSVVGQIQQEEGFQGKPYIDTTGNGTIGYGTKLPLTRSEGTMLLRERLNGIEKCLERNWKPWAEATWRARDVLLRMGYQMGCRGVLGFRKMLAALAAGDTQEAIREGRDSLWARTTPNRAEAVLRGLWGD